MSISKLDYKTLLDGRVPPLLEQSKCPSIWFSEENGEAAPAQMGNIWKKEQSGRMEECVRTWGR